MSQYKWYTETRSTLWTAKQKKLWLKAQRKARRRSFFFSSLCRYNGRTCKTIFCLRATQLLHSTLTHTHIDTRQRPRNARCNLFPFVLAHRNSNNLFTQATAAFFCFFPCFVPHFNSVAHGSLKCHILIWLVRTAQTTENKMGQPSPFTFRRRKRNSKIITSDEIRTLH